MEETKQQESEETVMGVPVANSCSTGRTYLELLLNKPMKVVISDGRTLIGQFLCTDREENIILGSCQEYIGCPDDENTEEPRLLGLAMIPGRHVVKMFLDLDKQAENDINFVLGKECAQEKLEVNALSS